MVFQINSTEKARGEVRVILPPINPRSSAPCGVCRCFQLRGDRPARIGLVVANCWQYRNKSKPCEKIYLSCSLIASSCKMPITREDRAKAQVYVSAVDEIEGKKRELSLLEAKLPELFDSLSENARQSQVPIEPKHWHAEAALKWVSEGTSKQRRTLTEAARLLNDGELPGDYFDTKVKISLRYISNIKVKIETGSHIQDDPGKPALISKFETEFIHFVLEHQQIRAKALLLSTVQMLVRVIVLIKRGAVAVADLDARVRFKGPKRGRRQSRRAAEDDSSDTDDEADPREEVEDNFTSLKEILGDSLSLMLQLPTDMAYPTRRQVRDLCAKNDWKVKKAQQTSAWRYDGVSPPIIASFFGNTLRIFVVFGITIPGQKANCDEKRLNAEFEKSGRCLAVICIKPSEKLSGHHRTSITNSASSRSIIGITFLPIVDADNVTIIIFFMRKGDPNSSDAKRKEADIWNACYKQFEDAGIELVVITTTSGYMNAETFILCMCHYLRALHRRKGLDFNFADPRNPKIEECPALQDHQILFLDNASHHKLGSIMFQMDCRIRKLQLVPFPPNTTNLLQPLDQDVLKLFTTWVMQFFLLEMEMEMSGGIKNPLHLVLWAQQVRQNNAHLEASSELILDLQADYAGNSRMQDNIRRLNATLQRANTEGLRFVDEVRVAKLCVSPWLASLKYARKSFEHVGLAAPEVDLGPTLRHGRQTSLQIEHDQEMLRRYELFPDRITSTSLYINAAEKYEKLEEAATQDRFSMYSKGAMLVGALPDLTRSMVCAGAAGCTNHAAKVAEVIFGPEFSPEAVELSKVVVQASAYVENHENKRQRQQAYQALMPNGVADVQQQVQSLISSNVSTMQQKVQTVHRSFEIVIEKATALEKCCLKLESQWTSISGRVFTIAVLPEYQKLLLAIHKERPKLAERSKTLDDELAKKVESRRKFLDNCRGEFVPEQNLKDALGDELNNDWGAGAVVASAQQAVARVIDFVYYEILDALAQHALEVDDDVHTILNDLYGAEPD